MPTVDFDLTQKDISELASADALAGFLTRLGYPTDRRETLSVTAFGLTGETADAVRGMELLAEDPEQFFRVVFVHLRSVTAKARNEIARNLGRRNADHLLILASDFDSIEFVLIDKETTQRHTPGGGASIRVIPRVVSVERKSPGLVERRILRRLTWTGKDGLDQFDKLRSVFQSAHYAEKYFTNRALFADHYLQSRLTEDPAWRESPSPVFARTKELIPDARSRWADQGEQIVRDELYDPVWELLGFKAKVNKSAKQDHLDPDYILNDSNGKPLSVAFCYRWDRWLDGPDLNDPDTPEENPGAAVVSALSRGDARWIIVTNGKLWRLYCKDAHSRSTNFYEVDIEEAIAASAETDPNEAFRYWWLFFRAQAFELSAESDPPACWLDTIVQGSRDYAKRLGDRLKGRIFVDIFPHLAGGFLLDRKKRLALSARPTKEELHDAFEATLTLLYRLLFLLYAESRDLLPIGESAYRRASLKQIKEEIAAKAGVAETEVPERLKVYSETTTSFYDRLGKLFTVMDRGDALLNVPCYNGGLFISAPDSDHRDREHHIAAFLAEHKVPDRQLALAIDRLARDQDEKTLALAFIDYKSLEVRHLGSIYEGLLEFKLKIAEEDLGVATEKKAEKYIPLSQMKTGRSQRRASAEAVVRKGEVYLSNDKADRKATGSYYTPDPIVEYIVEHTVGPVLAEKLDALRGDLDKAAGDYHRHLTNARNNPALLPSGSEPRGFAAAKTYAGHRALVDKVFDMKVLDPAMGSGHFLVESVDFITDRLLDFLNRYPHNPVRFMLDKTRRSILDALGEQGVTVDPDKLTDINLLKRHVLKRCIYGVDLNPMAVELAKVSLWLDAFTLGAPLSFLDHHLRCGNSLIGASFEDLRQATSGQLLVIDYEPLLKAINHVLFINAMSDATAAEVHKSAGEYARARGELSGYRIVLDLIVADHFVEQLGLIGRGKRNLKAELRTPTELLVMADRLDLTTREHLLKSLQDDEEREIVQRIESLARRPDLRFFHWEIEFPEVFFDFADSEHRRIKHKNEISAGSAGFDALVGNPPYGVDIEPPHRDFFTSKYGLRGKALNVAGVFIKACTHRVTDNGDIGLIVPKSLTYSDGWSPLVACILPTLTRLADVSKAFDEVLLEQCVFICRNALRAAPCYHIDHILLSKAATNANIPKTVHDEYGVLLTNITQEDFDIARKMSLSKITFGNVSDTFRGLSLQRYFCSHGTRVIGGKNIRKYGLRDDVPIQYVPKECLSGNKCERLSLPKIVSQNIVAHIENPFPHIRIIASMDCSGVISLDTVNNTIPTTEKWTLPLLIAFMNSKALSWYMYRFIYNQAIRTMHFDAHYVNRLPLPQFDGTIACTSERLVDQARKAIMSDDRYRFSTLLQEIDQIVFDAFGLTSKQAARINESTFHGDS